MRHVTTLLAATLLALVVATAAHAGKRSDVAKKLNRGLASTPMAGTGYLLEQAGHRYRVHPALIAAIAGTESSFGAAMCLPYNAWGISSCGRAWTAPTFRSWRHGINYTARFLYERWISRGVRDVWSIGRSYCPPCGNRWGDKVAFYMGTLGFPPEVRYP